MANDQKTYDLTVERREIIGKKTKQLRRQELVPAVVYGHRVDAESIQVPRKDLERVYLRAGSNSLIDLKIGEGGAARKVFIHNVQRNPVTHGLTHVDFLAVNLREEMTTSVPLVLTGESPAVERGEGILLQALDHVQVRALPMDLPSTLEVDISGLEELDQAIHVSDLQVPANVALLTPEDELVAKVTALRAEEVEEAPEEAAEGEEAEGEGSESDEEASTESSSDEDES